MARDGPPWAARLSKQNVDYSGTGATWGAHESYGCRPLPPGCARQLVPHLVSRLIYTGAGGFANRSPGMEFSLSPRALHMERAVSSESTCQRGIFHTRHEPLT